MQASATAKRYLARGWSVVPIPAMRKGPVLPEWQNLRLTADDADSHFTARSNIGVLTGEPSGWLVDVDVDHPLAVELADEFLPSTGAVFGRNGKPRSHRLYRVSGPVTTHKRALPKVNGSAPSVVELRATGCQTIFPGSIHPSGEPIEWDSDEEPATVSPDELRAQVDALADAVEQRLGVKRATNNGVRKTVNRIPIALAPDKSEQARRYLAKVPGAVGGQRGDDATFFVACVLVLDFDLSPDEALPLILEWNQTCSPPWPEQRLRYKLDEADKKSDPRGGKFRDRHAATNGHVHQQHDRGFEIHVVTSREFDSADYSVAYHVENVLAEREPLVIAAPLKSLKTTLAIALAVALALGRAFLDKFWVKEAVNVLILSGESGRSAMQSAGRRIAATYGHALGDIGRLFWSTDLPRLGVADHLEALRVAIVQNEIAVLICDPLYFMLPGQDAGNLMIIGAYLRTLSALCEELGVTLVVVHHVKKTRENQYEPPELSDVSWAGTAEWARQWILLGRREKYMAGTGEHRLWMVLGGSAGHSGLHALNVFEGVGNSRTWQVDVLSPDDVRDAKTEAREQARETAQTGRREQSRARLLQAAAKLPDGANQSQLRSYSGMSGETFKATVADCLRHGELVELTVKEKADGKGRTVTLYKLGETTV